MQFTLSSTASALVPFALGFAFKQGAIPTGRTIAADILEIQASVKNLWPDGSVKFAIISGLVAAVPGVAQTFSLQASSVASSGAPLSTADLRATGIVASVDCGGFGSVTWAGSDWDAPTTTWISGPILSSWTFRKAVGTDRHLVAWLEVRLFRDGSVDVLPWIENGYLNVTGPTNKLADYGFTLGGVQRFIQRIDLPNHCRTPLLSGSALSHWLGPDPGVIAYGDTDYLQATELVPTYFATVSPSAPAVMALPSTFTPLQRGSFPVAMGSGGYDPSIGLLPEWDVLYLTSTAPSVWAAIQRNAYSAGRYGIHYRDETTNRPPRFSSYPTTCLGQGSGFSPTGSSSTNTYTPTSTGTVPASYAASHAPSTGYLAYLVTGRWYHMETVQFASTANGFASTTSARENASMVLQTWAGGSTRRAAWALRTLAQALSATPDADTALRGEFIASVEANINRHHATYVGDAQGTMGWMQPSTNYTPRTTHTAGLGSTSTAIQVTAGLGSSETDYYVRTFANGDHWTVTIGGESREIVGFDTTTNNATFIGSVVGDVLTVSSMRTGTLVVGSRVSGTGVVGSTQISAFGTGTGGVGTYTLNSSTQLAPPGTNFTAQQYVLTVTPAFTGPTAGQSCAISCRHWYEASWMQDFYTGALGYLMAMNPPISAPVHAKLAEFFAWKARSIVGRFGTAAAGDYLYRDAAVYEMPITESESPTWASWYTDWGLVWADAKLQNTYLGVKEIGDGSLRGTVSARAYWGNLQPALSYAVRFGVPGAANGMALMKGAPNWATGLVPDFNANPVWSVRPATP